MTDENLPGLDATFSAAAQIFFHLSCTALVGVVTALGLIGPARLQALSDAYASGLSPRWTGLLLHTALAGCGWGVLVIAYRHLARRLGGSQDREEGQLRIIRSTDGSVMTETLIVLPFLLLVTSGIAQLTMINLTGVLADLAAWDAARTAWIWEAERNLGRNGVDRDDVWVRSLTAASMTLAPTAGTDFTVGRNYDRGSRPDFRRIRTAIVASFRKQPQQTGADEWSQSQQNWGYFDLFGGTGTNSFRSAEGRDLSVAQAFDSVDVIHRAGRKCTQAFMSLEDNFDVVRENGEVGVEFTYEYNLLFPWYAYIFGRVDNIGNRASHYAPISRKFMFPEQTQF